MKVIHPSIFTLFEQFPDSRDAIRSRFRQDKTFQLICEDYRKCLEALRHWKRSAKQEAGHRQKEYRALLGELHNEIMQHLDETG